MTALSELKFHGTWRSYQQRVLDHSQKYSADKHLHIVAAPGSGKTTLGIELIRRIGAPVLILVPTVTIREQWAARIRAAFLPEGAEGEGLISQDLRRPALLTLATYQALHSAMKRRGNQGEWTNGEVNGAETADGGGEADEVEAADGEEEALTGKKAGGGARRSAESDEAEADGDDGETDDADVANGKEETLTEKKAGGGARRSAESDEAEADGDDGETDDADAAEDMDAAFDLIETLRARGLGTLCLDECHHLRSEWWKALESFRAAFPELFVIALTATPPYDSAPAQWERYIAMCGEIDEEITAPELVKDGTLCPHQDYVLLNYPTKEEEASLEAFDNSAQEAVRKLMADEDFAAAVQSHRFFTEGAEAEELLEKPAYLSALLIFLHEKGLPFPERYQRLLGAKRLEAMSRRWMEILLQGLLYDDCASYRAVSETQRRALIHWLKGKELIEKRVVTMQRSRATERLLVSSAGKCESIRRIVMREYETMGGGLRLLLLTDYIRREYLPALGDSEQDIGKIGVLPLFELLRREAAARGLPLRLAVLCGSLVAIPAETKAAFLKKLADKRAGGSGGCSSEAVAGGNGGHSGGAVSDGNSGHSGGVVSDGNSGHSGETASGENGSHSGIVTTGDKGDSGRALGTHLRFSPLGALTDYLEIEAPESLRGEVIRAVGELFEVGAVQVLVGTKSLLGEGWDSPCVNALVLASFVGSYMLSNQMRGRAIRIWPGHPEKTANIWHLVCVKKGSAQEGYDDGEDNPDYQMLVRRMEHFLGLSYDREVIENGIGRLVPIRLPFTPSHVKKANEEMLLCSGQREELGKRWKNALTAYDKIEVVDQTEVGAPFLAPVLLVDALRGLLIALGAALLGGVGLFFWLRGGGEGAAVAAPNVFFMIYGGVWALLSLPFFKRLFTFATPLGRLKAFGNGIRDALLASGELSSEDSVVETESQQHLHLIYLHGGSGRDKEVFSRCMREFFSEIDNQRYLLYQKKHRRRIDGYFAVPECFAKRKESAELFAACLKKRGYAAEAVYTRSEAGRQILLQGRIHALANRQNRLVSRKKVKGALE